MIIIRCANGVVIYYYGPLQRDNSVQVICLNDGVRMPLKVQVKGTTHTQLAALITHAVQLAGAFQQLAVMPLQVGA